MYKNLPRDVYDLLSYSTQQEVDNCNSPIVFDRGWDDKIAHNSNIKYDFDGKISSSGQEVVYGWDGKPSSVIISRALPLSDQAKEDIERCIEIAEQNRLVSQSKQMEEAEKLKKLIEKMSSSEWIAKDRAHWEKTRRINEEKLQKKLKERQINQARVERARKCEDLSKKSKRQAEKQVSHEYVSNEKCRELKDFIDNKNNEIQTVILDYNQKEKYKIDGQKYKIDINASCCRMHDKATPLINAVRAHQVESVRLLLTMGADLNKKDRHGKTAYDYAKGYKNKEIANLIFYKDKWHLDVSDAEKLQQSVEQINENIINRSFSGGSFGIWAKPRSNSHVTQSQERIFNFKF